MDTSLTLKPIELIDIGIDKLTKIPMPILKDNLVSTYDIESGIPIDTFTFIVDTSKSSLSGSCTFYSDPTYPVSLNFDWGDGRISPSYLVSGYTTVDKNFGFYYDTTGTYTITVTGGVSLITEFMMINQGVTSVSLTNLKKLIKLDLSNNFLTTININGLIYLKYIYLGYNNISDVDYDIYISADTFLSLDGVIDTYGGNALPTIYSEQDRNSLKIKGWTLSPLS